MSHLQALAINISPLLTPPMFFLSFSWTLCPDLINLANSIHLKKKKEKQKTKIGLLLHPLFYFSVPQRPVLFCFRRLVVLGSISILSLLFLSQKNFQEHPSYENLSKLTLYLLLIVGIIACISPSITFFLCPFFFLFLLQTEVLTVISCVFVQPRLILHFHGEKRDKKKRGERDKVVSEKRKKEKSELSCTKLPTVVVFPCCDCKRGLYCAGRGSQRRKYVWDYWIFSASFLLLVHVMLMDTQNQIRFERN